MTTYSMPSAPGFSSASFGLRSNTQTFTSPLTGKLQVIELTGARWYASYTLPPLTEAEAGEWIAFLTKLRGQANSFFAHDPARTTAQGTPTGTPLVNGAGQTGTNLITDGWTASTLVLKAGDYISVAATQSKLFMVVDDAVSNAGGQVTLIIEPGIKTSPADGAEIKISTPTCVMRLDGSDVTWNISVLKHLGISFSATETL
tara:strand:+ start:9154 stop:9759 length:606 start_codon:yes stop_codon:yes gene_type:complete